MQLVPPVHTVPSTHSNTATKHELPVMFIQCSRSSSKSRKNHFSYGMQIKCCPIPLATTITPNQWGSAVSGRDPRPLVSDALGVITWKKKKHNTHNCYLAKNANMNGTGNRACVWLSAGVVVINL